MQIHYKIVEFTLKAETEINLPDFKGSAFRGGFGNILRQITCVLKRQQCIDCPIKTKCIYAYVFETVSDTTANFLNMHKYEKVPHPFVFEPPLDKKKLYQPAEEFKFKIILIGKAIEYLPYFVVTIKELGKVGIGKAKGKFIISNISSSNSETISLNSVNLEQNFTKL
ncbi:MAG: CRISPR-associated protein Cas6, partial [Thermodesulfovibrio sp.]